MKIAYQVVTQDMKLYTPAYEVKFVGEEGSMVGFVYRSGGEDTFIPYDEVAFYTRASGEFTIEDVVGAFGKEALLDRAFDCYYGDDIR